MLRFQLHEHDCWLAQYPALTISEWTRLDPCRCLVCTSFHSIKVQCLMLKVRPCFSFGNCTRHYFIWQGKGDDCWRLRQQHRRRLVRVRCNVRCNSDTEAELVAIGRHEPTEMSRPPLALDSSECNSYPYLFSLPILCRELVSTSS